LTVAPDKGVLLPANVTVPLTVYSADTVIKGLVTEPNAAPYAVMVAPTGAELGCTAVTVTPGLDVAPWPIMTLPGREST
jgi:hypothetical protein